MAPNTCAFEGKLGPPVVPFYPFVGEGPPTKIEYRKEKCTLILTSLLEHPVKQWQGFCEDWQAEPYKRPGRGPLKTHLEKFEMVRALARKTNLSQKWGGGSAPGRPCPG